MSVGSPCANPRPQCRLRSCRTRPDERAVTPSGGCGCASCQAKEGEKEGAGKVAADTPPWAFALGQIGYDLISEARRDRSARPWAERTMTPRIRARVARLPEVAPLGRRLGPLDAQARPDADLHHPAGRPLCARDLRLPDRVAPATAHGEARCAERPGRDPRADRRPGEAARRDPRAGDLPRAPGHAALEHPRAPRPDRRPGPRQAAGRRHVPRSRRARAARPRHDARRVRRSTTRRPAP